MSRDGALPSASYRRRREAFITRMVEQHGDAVAIFPAAPVVPRDYHTPQAGYRPDTDLHYLTGFAEPHAVAVITRAGLTLFVQPDAPDMLNGPKVGLDRAVSDFGADRAFAIGELDAKLPGLIANRSAVLYRLGRDPAFDDKVLAILVKGRGARRDPTRWPTQIADSAAIVHELRLVKDADEIALLERAAEIAGNAHRVAMAIGRPGTYEHEVEAAMLHAVRRTGARPAYGFIVASGPNTSIIQYWQNDRRIEGGELVLVDGGCMCGQLASDVTRTFPASGTFSPSQRAVYEVVLATHEAGLACVAPGSSIEKIHDAHVLAFTRGLVTLGILKGSLEELVSKNAHKPYTYLPRSTHWLGMDILDVGSYYETGGVARPLVAGMVMSMEPGLYLPNDETVPPELRGIGARVEDNVLVTPTGHRVLTEAIPRTIAEIEAACRAPAPQVLGGST